MTAYVCPPQLDNAYPDFGEDMLRRLDKVIADSGLSPGRFARVAGISAQSLRHTHRMAGRSMPALGTLSAICVAHDVSMNWLLFGRGAESLTDAGFCQVCVPSLGHAA
ncbi:MAG: helix-turn-helix transcriptional regulator [Pseudomonadota bacterium]